VGGWECWILASGHYRRGAEGAAAPDPKNRGSSSHRTLSFFPVKLIYSRHKYVKIDVLSISLV
jgi:hypothetical protein